MRLSKHLRNFRRGEAEERLLTREDEEKRRSKQQERKGRKGRCDK